MMKLSLATLIFSASALAAPPPVSSAGSACPAGSVSTVTSPDGSTVTVLFDSFVASLAPSEPRLALECSFALPIVAPAGFRAGVYKIDYRGFVFLPAKVSATFRVDYESHGPGSPAFHRRFQGSREEDFLITDTIGAGQMRWTECGTSSQLKAQASWLVERGPGRPSSNQSDEALASLDTADGAPKGGITFHLQWKKCR